MEFQGRLNGNNAVLINKYMIMRFYILCFISLLGDAICAQTMKVEMLNNGASIPSADILNLLTADDIDITFINVESGCIRHKVDATTLQVTSLPSKNLIAFSPAMFATCTPLALNLSHVKVIVKVINLNHPLYGYSGHMTFLYQGSVNYYGDNGLNLMAPLSLSVSDQTKCAGTTTNTITATISNVPADFRMEEYRLDWGDNRIVTSDVSVMGGVATVRGIVKEDLKETVEGLFPRLLKNGMVLAVAEEPYCITVKEAATVSLRAELAGKMAGDEVFFEARDDNRQENLTYRWFVNAELVAGRLDWFTSGRLQEGDVVKCGVTGDCPVESFSNEIKVYFTDVRDNNRPGMDNGGFRIPNVLTPNNDGVNDVWKLDFLQDYPDHLITIYDYAGKVVYQTRHYRNDWDGKVNEVLTYGVYTCVINLGNKKTLKTWLDVRTNNK